MKHVKEIIPNWVELKQKQWFMERMAKTWSSKFEDKHQTETNKEFQAWEEK